MQIQSRARRESDAHRPIAEPRARGNGRKRSGRLLANPKTRGPWPSPEPTEIRTTNAQSGFSVSSSTDSSSLSEEPLFKDGHVARLAAASLAAFFELRVKLSRPQIDGVWRWPTIGVEPIRERFHTLTVVKHVLRHLYRPYAERHVGTASEHKRVGAGPAGWRGGRHAPVPKWCTCYLGSLSWKSVRSVTASYRRAGSRR